MAYTKISKEGIMGGLQASLTTSSFVFKEMVEKTKDRSAGSWGFVNIMWKYRKCFCGMRG